MCTALTSVINCSAVDYVLRLLSPDGVAGTVPTPMPAVTPPAGGSHFGRCHTTSWSPTAVSAVMRVAAALFSPLTVPDASTPLVWKLEATSGIIMVFDRANRRPMTNGLFQLILAPMPTL